MTAQGIHLLTGQDRARKLQRIQSFERSLKVDSLDSHHLDAGSVTVQELLTTCRQRPASGQARLVVVDAAQRLTAAAVASLLAHAETIAQTACVVLLVESELPGKHPLAAARDRLSVEDFPARDVPELKPFVLTEALGQRDAAKALSALHDQLTAGREPVEILGLLAWQVQRWLTVRRLMDQRLGAEKIGEVTGVRAWQIQRVQSELSGRSRQTLAALLERCRQTDGELKSSRTVPVLALERLVIELCGADAVTSSSGLSGSSGASGGT